MSSPAPSLASCASSGRSNTSLATIPSSELSSWPFVIPIKHIDELKADLALFSGSVAYSSITTFISGLNRSVLGVAVSRSPSASPSVVSLLTLLDAVHALVQQFPPIQQPQRFGNKAFAAFHTELQQRGQSLLEEMLPNEVVLSGAIQELLPYLASSFGDPTRIDYGTGHELNFVAFLCCLYKLGFVVEEDFPNLVLRVFLRYLAVMRTLQTRYLLEPAGSKGVWGLDDYQFLPLLWGAAQLTGHDFIKPKSIHNEDVVNGYCDEYMYLSCIKFVKQMKTGYFAEHSPLLNDISAVPRWQKVNSGLLKMYHAEVLNKFPVVQHFLFGSLLPFLPSK